MEPVSAGLDDAEIERVERLQTFPAHSPARGVAVCPSTGQLFATAGHQVIAVDGAGGGDEQVPCSATDRHGKAAAETEPVPTPAAMRAAVASAAPDPAGQPLWAPSSDEEEDDSAAAAAQAGTTAAAGEGTAAAAAAAAAGTPPAAAAEPNPLVVAGQGWNVIAGGSERGCEDGPAHAARFDHPAGLAVSPDGGWIVVCDYWNNRLASISLGVGRSSLPRGTVRTLVGEPGTRVGSFVSSGRDGTSHHRLAGEPAACCSAGSSAGSPRNPNTHEGETSCLAGVSCPSDCCFDRLGNLYFVSMGDNGNTVRVLNTAGSVRTLAGVAGSRGRDSAYDSARRGDGWSSQLLDPKSISVVSGTAWGTVAEEDPCGDPGGSIEAGGSERSVAVAFVADAMNRKIKAVASCRSQQTAAPLLVRLAGSGGPGDTDGPGCDARFNQPVAVAAGPGSDGRGWVWVLDRSWGPARLAVVTEDHASDVRGRWSAPGIAQHAVVKTVESWAVAGHREMADRGYPFMTKPVGLALGRDSELYAVESGEASAVFRATTRSSQRFRLLRVAQRCAFGLSLHGRCGGGSTMEGARLPACGELHEQVVIAHGHLAGPAVHACHWSHSFITAMARWRQEGS